jgi:pyrimidine operon attenuation protein/uracil phosphoribosyltransferase
VGDVAAQKTIGSGEVRAALERLAAAIRERHGGTRDLFILGIANGGIPLAHRLGRMLGARRVGDLDISFHRDDIGTHPVPKAFAMTLLPGDVNGTTVILVDDVLFTGRTVKAALDELFDHGRPAKVELAVLVDRGGRRLPVVADFTGTTVRASDAEDVIVTLDEDPSRDRIDIRAKGAPSRRAAKPR